MKFMDKAVKNRCEYNSDNGDEDEAAEQGVTARENFPAGRV